MKIIKPGDLDAKILCQGTCVYCGCVVEFTTDEGTPHQGRYNEVAYRIKCPTLECPHYIYGVTYESKKCD